MMSCKLTAGEVRKCRSCEERFRCDYCWKVIAGERAVFGRSSCIVEVAPINRARVTAGPTWMSTR